MFTYTKLEGMKIPFAIHLASIHTLQATIFIFSPHFLSHTLSPLKQAASKSHCHYCALIEKSHILEQIRQESRFHFYHLHYLQILFAFLLT